MLLQLKNFFPKTRSLESTSKNKISKKIFFVENYFRRKFFSSKFFSPKIYFRLKFFGGVFRGFRRSRFSTKKFGACVALNNNSKNLFNSKNCQKVIPKMYVNLERKTQLTSKPGFGKVFYLSPHKSGSASLFFAKLIVGGTNYSSSRPVPPKSFRKVADQ